MFFHHESNEKEVVIIENVFFLPLTDGCEAILEQFFTEQIIFLHTFLNALFHMML